MGIHTVAVHSTADADAMHVRLADESVCIGPPPARDSYLNIPAILSAATITGADAIHPGYGFLSENANFAAMVEEHGLVFIGPSPEHIRMMGDKVQAKATMKELGVPVVPGSDGPVASGADVADLADGIGYPVLIKAAAGGGGRGMKVAQSRDQLDDAGRASRARRPRPTSATTRSISRSIWRRRAISSCRSWPTATATSSTWASATARCSAGTRSCSRRRPRPRSTPRRASGSARIGADALKKFGYRNAGTIEFLYENGEFYFIEMNTRLQVEHPVTEMITGFDIVREQIRIAAGAPLSIRQEEVALGGHAIECRINAENPDTFAPSPGRISEYHRARRPWRARRFGALFRLPRAAALR